MREDWRTQLRLALSIISGRRAIEDLDSWHYELLGIKYPRGPFEQKSRNEILEICEDIVFDLIEKPLEDK